MAADFGLGIFIWGVPIALVAVWPNQVFALVLLGIVGIGNTIVDVSGMTLLQRSAPDDVLARVFGVLESLLLLSIGLGAVVAPLLLNWLGTRGALIVAGALLPLVVVPAWPALAAIDRAARIPTEQLELLRGNPIFAALPAGTLEQLAEALDKVRIGAGEEVVRRVSPETASISSEKGLSTLRSTAGPRSDSVRGRPSARSRSCGMCRAPQPFVLRPTPSSTRWSGANSSRP